MDNLTIKVTGPHDYCDGCEDEAACATLTHNVCKDWIYWWMVTDGKCNLGCGYAPDFNAALECANEHKYRLSIR